MALDDARPNLLVGLQRDRIPVTEYRDAFFWTCEECGWLGTGHFSLNQAMREAGDHWNAEHGDLTHQPLVERRDMRKLPTLDEVRQR